MPATQCARFLVVLNQVHCCIPFLMAISPRLGSSVADHCWLLSVCVQDDALEQSTEAAKL